MKEQEASGLLNTLGTQTLLNKISFQVLFFCFRGIARYKYKICNEYNILTEYNILIQDIKMNEIVSKFLLAGDKFVSEMHLRQPGSTFSACGSFRKNKKGIQKFKETGDSQYIHQSELNSACFFNQRNSF